MEPELKPPPLPVCPLFGSEFIQVEPPPSVLLAQKPNAPPVMYMKKDFTACQKEKCMFWKTAATIEKSCMVRVALEKFVGAQ